MKYDISKKTAPAMPKLGKGTEFIKLLLSQASNDVQEPLVPMLFPSLGAHICNTKFQYPDRSWKEMCGMMAQLVGPPGSNKGQLSDLVKAICYDFRIHDQGEDEKMKEWLKKCHATKKNQPNPECPTIAYWYPPADTTKPAFLKNAIALEETGKRTQYFDLPEVEMANGLCGGHRNVSLMMRNVFDRARAGALRATSDGVSGNPTLRACITISGVPETVRAFYKYELFNGTFGRMVFSYKKRTGNRDGRIPRKGEQKENFLKKVDEYIAKLNACAGKYVIPQLNKLIDTLAQDMATLADLTDDDTMWDCSKRSLVSSWKAGCIMWVLNDQTWTRSMGELVEWLVYHDLWSKAQLFADLMDNDKNGLSEVQKRGPKNMLDSLPDSFNEAQLEALRLELGKSKEGTKAQLSLWVFRKFITFSAQTGMYTKTEEYLNG